MKVWVVGSTCRTGVCTQKGYLDNRQVYTEEEEVDIHTGG